MKVYFKLKNGKEYKFKNVRSLREQFFEKTGAYYTNLVEGINAAYGEMSLLFISNVRVI